MDYGAGFGSKESKQNEVKVKAKVEIEENRAYFRTPYCPLHLNLNLNLNLM